MRQPRWNDALGALVIALPLLLGGCSDLLRDEGWEDEQEIPASSTASAPVQAAPAVDSTSAGTAVPLIAVPPEAASRLERAVAAMQAGDTAGAEAELQRIAADYPAESFADTDDPSS